jgi:hypothetical protein
MGVTTDTAITATTIGITTTTIIIVTGHGLPLSTVTPATTATIETSPLFEIALVLVRLDALDCASEDYALLIRRAPALCVLKSRD